MQHRAAFYCFVLLFSMTVSHALAGPPYAVSDPGTPKRHWIELNIGFLSSQARGDEFQSLPNIDLNYGYLDNVQLTLGMTAATARSGTSRRTFGFGDIWPEVKWRFQEETKSRPQFAIDYAIKIPTAGRACGLGTGCVDQTFLFVWQKTLGRSAVFGNIGYSAPGDRGSRNNILWGLVLATQMSERLNVGVEFYGNTSDASGERSETAIGLGLTYAFAPNRALLLKAGRSLQSFSDLNIYAGIRFDLGKRSARH